MFSPETSTIIIARYKEDSSWVSKFNNYKTIVYEKETPDAGIYNIPVNKGGEASAYLKYIVDHYDNLPTHVVLIHCHEYSWHHVNSIIDLINSYTNTNIEFQNINDSEKCWDMGDYQNWTEGELGYFYNNLIKPAVGDSSLYPKFTVGITGCAQFIIHKDRILKHSYKFYENIYNWIIETNLSYYNHGYYLEWTWELIFNKYLNNTYIKIYENESILYILELDNKYKFVKSDLTDKVNSELKSKDYYKNDGILKIIILTGNKTIREVISTNNYIYNKYI